MRERSTSEQALLSAIIEEAEEWEVRIINKSFFYRNTQAAQASAER